MKIKKIAIVITVIAVGINGVVAPVIAFAIGGSGTQSGIVTTTSRRSVLEQDTTAAQILADVQTFATQYGITISSACPTAATQNGNTCEASSDANFGALKVYSVMLIEELSKWPTDILQGMADHTIYLVQNSGVAGPNGISGQVAGVYYPGDGIVYNTGFNNSDYQRRIVQHEFIHLLDFQTRNTGKALNQATWESYNPNGYVYANYSGNCYEGNPSCSTGFQSGDGFITSYAKAAYVEDVAETGAALMTERGNTTLEALVATDTALANKVTLLKSFLTGLSSSIDDNYLATMHSYGQQFDGELDSFFGYRTDDGITQTTTIPEGANFSGLLWAMGVKGEADVLVVDGKIGDVTVQGGILRGTGAVGKMNVLNGGVVAPGHSPGCLSSSDVISRGEYQVEIGGTTACSGYDQLQVAGTVDINGSTLTPSLYNNFVPSVGQSYTIVSNDGSDPITGTFANTPSNTILVGGVTYSVNYAGGDGNDIVLTITNLDPSLIKAAPANVPTAPDTGFGLVASHPLHTFGISLGSSAALLYISRRLKLIRTPR